MILFTAPSKTQSPPIQNNPAYQDFTLPQSLNKSTQLINELKKLTEKQLAELMKTSAKLTTATLQKIRSFSTPFTLENAGHTLRTFHGDAYDAITAEQYTVDQLNYAQDHLIILSGLYGILRPLDLMQPYRLEMGTRLKFSGYKNLYQFWQEEITAKVLALLTQTSDATLINLASAEYSKAIDKKQIIKNGGRMIEVLFQQPHPKGKDRYNTIPIHSKRARGKMIHFAIQNNVTEAEKLQEFSADGYLFIPVKSTPQTWLFRKM